MYVWRHCKHHCWCPLEISARDILIKKYKWETKHAFGMCSKWQYSLYSRGDEGHTDHHQVQNIEIVSTEWTFMEEGAIGRHL